MKRDWLFCRIAGAASATPSVLPRLVRRVRLTDPDSRWFFQHLPESREPELGLWFHAVPEVLRDVEDQLHLHGRRVVVEHRTDRPARQPRTGERDVVDDLSTLSSDFALEVLGSGLSSDEYLAFTVAHLRALVGLVPATQRLGFLFLCWQHWSPQVRPERRGSLVGMAGGYVGLAGWPDGGHRSAVVRRYLDVVARTLAHDDGIPANYLLFDHAHHTHQRLGIPPEVEALAAQVVRAEHRAGSEPAAAVLP